MVINGSTNPKMYCHVFPAERRLLRNLPEIPKSICTQDPAMSKCGFNTCSKICRKICSWGLTCYPAKWCGYGSRHMEPPDKNKPKIAGKWEAHPPYIYIKMLLFGSDRGCLFAFADVSKNLLQVAVGGCLHGSAGNIIVVWPYKIAEIRNVTNCMQTHK